MIHPRAWISPGVSMGKCNVVLPDVVITAEAQIQDFNIFYVGSLITYYAKVASYCFLDPHVRLLEDSGVEEGVFLGRGWVLIGGATVGAWARVGANAVVNRDVVTGTTVVGLPAAPVGHPKAIGS